MKLQIMPWLFLVRINKKEQAEFKTKVSKSSPFFMPIGQIHSSRNMEHGEIVQIGEKMKGIYGWENCQVGDTLIFHHTIEDVGKSATQQYWVYEDEVYNYYIVDEINVRGFTKGGAITPHPNFVFLKNIPCYETDGMVDEHTGNKLKKSEGGLFVITGWENSASNIAQKSEAIKEHIESLTKSKRTPEIQTALESMEAERIELNRKAQKRMYLPYRVAAVNRKLKRDFGQEVLEDDILMCFNKSCLYISNFQDKEEYSYIVALTEHIGGLIIDNF